MLKLTTYTNESISQKYYTIMVVWFTYQKQEMS